MSVPRLISRYEVKGLIARGGMGDLYLARDPNTTRLVVVKLLSATFESADLRERFEREARSLASLNHPNIVHIYDYGDVDDTPFIVIEYVRGETLAEKIKRRAALTPAQKLKLIVDLCAGLAHAHSAGVIHRDVKPSNLMVDQDDRLKILDFGIARVAGSNLTRFGVLASQLVMQIGTPGYMSPEQIQGGDIDGRADIFGVGAVCYALLAYRDPFQGKDADEIERSVMKASPVPLMSLVPDLDPEVDAIVTRALSRAREDRFPDMESMGEALERCRLRAAQSEPPRESTRQSSASMPATPASVAYQRATTLYEQGSRDAARRFAVEALAEDPNHPSARALLTRIQTERRPQPGLASRPPTQAAIPKSPGASPTSREATTEDPTNPTVHIPAVQRPDSSTELAPTIMIKPGERPQSPAATDATIRIPSGTRPHPASADPSATLRPTARTRATPAGPMRVPGPAPESSRPVALDPDALFGRSATTEESPGEDATVLIRPTAGRPLEHGPAVAPPAKPRDKKASRPPTKRFWAQLPSLGALWPSRASRPFGVGVPKVSPTRPGARPAGLWEQYGVSIGIAAALLMLMGGIAAVAVWLLTPTGYVLTVSRPVNGTIAGYGLRCGTGGADCSVTVSEGEVVQLTQEPDAGYAFDGFTGDCAPVGRFAMSGPLTCSATFVAVPTAAPPPKTWTLTLLRPTGGTLMAAGNQCGNMGSDCSVEVPDGLPVTVYATADQGFERASFIGDCAPSGQLQMTGPRSCGATFVARASGPRTPKPPDKVVENKIPPATVPPPPPPQVPPGGSNTQVGNPVVVEAGKVEPVLSDDDHARTKEIPVLLKQYCAALESLQAKKVQEVFPAADLNFYRRNFEQYRALKCAIGEPKYSKLDGKAGTAELEVEVKQTNQYKTGGAPDVTEFNVTMILSRPEERTTWRIVKLTSVPKKR